MSGTQRILWGTYQYIHGRPQKQDSDHLGMGVWVTLPVKDPVAAAEALAEGKGNMEWAAEEASHGY